MTELGEVLVENYRFLCIIGVHEWERVTEQYLSLDLSLIIDRSAVRESRQLSDTVDYVAAAERVKNIAIRGRYELLECLAEDACTDLLATFARVREVTLTLRKPDALSDADAVGFKLSLKRD